MVSPSVQCDPVEEEEGIENKMMNKPPSTLSEPPQYLHISPGIWEIIKPLKIKVKIQHKTCNYIYMFVQIVVWNWWIIFNGAEECWTLVILKKGKKELKIIDSLKL